MQRFRLFGGASRSDGASGGVAKGSAPAASATVGAASTATSKGSAGATGGGGGEEKVTSTNGRDAGPGGVLDGEAKRVLRVAARHRSGGGLRAYDYSEVQRQVRALARLGDQRHIVLFGPQPADDEQGRFKDLLSAGMLANFVASLDGSRKMMVAKAENATLNWYYSVQETYLADAVKQRDRTITLMRRGLHRPEARMFLTTYGFRDALPGDGNAQPAAVPAGPQIDVKSSFIGDKVLGRMHLYIVYTTADGRQHYFRGGPGEEDSATHVSLTRVHHGPYFPGTVDWDPTAPSTTVAKGPAADGKLDSLLEAAGAVDSMGVPYVSVGGMLRGENCNATAWTLLDRVGLPKKKPTGVHPGWGHTLGSFKKQGKDAPLKRVPHGGEAGTRVGATGGGTLIFGDRELLEPIGFLRPGDIAHLVEWTKTSSAEQSDATSVSRLRLADGRTAYCEGRYVSGVTPAPDAPRDKAWLAGGSVLDYGDTMHHLDKEMTLDADKAMEFVHDDRFIAAWRVVPVLMYGRYFVSTRYVSVDSFNDAAEAHAQAQRAAAKARDKADRKAERKANRKARKKSAKDQAALKERLRAAIEADEASPGIKPPIAGTLQTYDVGGEKGDRKLVPRQRHGPEFLATPAGVRMLPTGNTAGVEGRTDDYLLADWVLKNPGVTLIEVSHLAEFRWVVKQEYEDFLAMRGT